MTTVIVIQGLVGALAGLLFFESRLRRDEHARGGSGGDDNPEPIEFHPELIVRWDDEANHARQTLCTRKRPTDRTATIRPQVPVSGLNTNIR